MNECVGGLDGRSPSRVGQPRREVMVEPEAVAALLRLRALGVVLTQPPETGPRIRGICSTLVREEDRCARAVSVKSRSSGS